MADSMTNKLLTAPTMISKVDWDSYAYPVFIHYLLPGDYFLAMRKLFFGIIPWLAACHSNSPTLSLAYINSILVMQQYHGTLIKRQQLEVKTKSWQHSLDSLTTALGASRLPAAAQQVQIVHYRAVLQQKVQAASEQADQELIKEVNQYLKEYGRSKQYDFILGANESGNIVYATPSKDLTSDVLRGLNQQYDQHHVAAR